MSRITYFNGRAIFLIDGLPESTSCDSVGQWEAELGRGERVGPRHRKCAVVLDRHQGQAWRWPQKRPVLALSALDGVSIPAVDGYSSWRCAPGGVAIALLTAITFAIWAVPPLVVPKARPL